MNTKILRLLTIIGIAIFLAGLGNSQAALAGKPSQPRYIEFLASQSATQQEPISTGALSSPTVDINQNKPTLEISLSTNLLCGEPLQSLATNFSVSLRVDGVVVYTAPVIVSSYQQIPFNITAVVNGLSNTAHHVDIYVDAGSATVVFMSSPSSPTTLSVIQY